MAKNNDLFKKIVSHSKEYGFVFPSSEIYDGLGAVYDYGPYGVELKNNIRQYWWKSMVQMHKNIVGLDAAIFMEPRVWKASGHADAFNDPLIDNKDSKKRYRADVLVEEWIAKQESKIEKESKKAAKRFGDSFNRDMFLATNPRIVGYKEKIQAAESRMKAALESEQLDDLKQLIIDLDIADPDTGSRNWTDVRQFNLMFDTQLGSVAGEASKLYLRPETAQGIFVNFLNVQKSARQKIPFGIAQTGKAFRNEIVARQWLFRMREFEQMEMQFFVRPGEEMKWFDYWKTQRLDWHKSLGIANEDLRLHEHLKLAHYANAAVDIEYRFPIGFKEVEGIHSRTDYDLKQHQELSGRKLQYFDPELNESYVPYVVETSIGLDRTFLLLLSHAFCVEQVPDAKGNLAERTVLKIPAPLAPVKLAILPLVKKDGLPEIAMKIFDTLRFDFNCQYDEKDAIGRRYRRQDAIGTPYCITVDHQSTEDGTLTLRNRDSMKQERVAIDSLSNIIASKVDMSVLLKKA